MNIAVVILTAGIGKRMRSAKHKVLHELCDRPMISFILDTAKRLNPAKIVAVVGHQAQTVVSVLGSGIQIVSQEEQLGTGHALILAKSALASFSGPILVLPGDTPLLRDTTLAKLVKLHERKGAAATVLTAEVENPYGYGRVISGTDGSVTRIVEEKDASPAERRIKTINGGVYCFQGEKLFQALERVSTDNKQGEYYLTDVIGIFNKDGERVVAAYADEQEIIGVNSRMDLSRAEGIIQAEIKQRLMASGVTFILADTTFIGMDVAIGRDSIMYPNTFLSGATNIGENCSIGPSVRITDTKIGRGAAVQYAVVTDATIGDEVSVGPFCFIRPGTVIKKGGKAGTFVELKNSVVGEKSKVPHLSYIGDANLGRDVNVGAGTITCNYDGVNKWGTVIEDGVFLGSDTMLVAPVNIGKGAVTAAGSAITEDVPADSLGIERAEQKNIPGWADKHRRKAEKKRKT